MNIKRQASVKKFITSLHDSERLYIIKQCVLAMTDAEVKFSVKPLLRKGSANNASAEESSNS